MDRHDAGPEVDIDSSPQVRALVALARDAAMSTSYKPALLKALVILVRSGAGNRISLHQLGEQFTRLYWMQTVVFRLRQASTLANEPEVVQEIRASASRHAVRRLHDLPDAEREKLHRRMAGILKINVLGAFHRSAPGEMRPLFTWQKGDGAIDVPPAAYALLRSNDLVIEALANFWWARYLERVNALAPLIIEKVERDGAERTSLARYLAILRHLDDDVCFYCERRLADARGVHIDHVIPWSFLLSDPAWDLVLSCQPCNLSKSDMLPDRAFLDKLALVHGKRAQATLPRGLTSPFLQVEELFRYYDAALSVEWPAGWSPAVT